MKLVVTIDRDLIAGAFREGDGGGAPLPDFAPAPAGWLREIEAADEVACAGHLAELRALSLLHPLLALRITGLPEDLALTNGSFGEHEAEISALIAWTGAGGTPLATDGAGLHEVLYISVALPAEAHRRFLDLVRGQIPTTWPADTLHVSASPASIELGFELAWGALRAVQVVSLLQQAWAQEGSRATCVVELDGLAPIVSTITDAYGWMALEREILAAAKMARPAAPVVSEPDEPSATWIDDRGRCFVLADGDAIAEVDARTEARSGGGTIVRRGDGTWTLTVEDGTLELAADPACVREVAGCSPHGAVVAERREGGGDSVRFHVCDALGTRSSRAIADVAAYAIAGHLGQLLVALADPGGGSHLETYDIARFAPAREAVWPADAAVTGLAMLGRRTLVAVADGALFVVDVPTGELQRTRYLPCIDPRIVKVDRERDAVWLVGGGITAREDLVCVELGRDWPTSVTVVTAGLAAAGWGALHAAPFANGDWLLAYATKGVFRLTKSAVEPIAALGDGERITGAAAGGVRFVATVAGPSGARLVVGGARLRSVALAAPGALLRVT